MSRIVMDVSMSLDGFTTGPNVRPEEPMGDGGEGLHVWYTGIGPRGAIDREVAAESDGTICVTIVGRRTYELGRDPWGGTPWPGVSCFVVTHRTEPDQVADNGGTFFFTGLEDAARRAKETAKNKDVYVLGAEVGRHLLRAGLLDVVRLHLVPMLLGSGTRLFDGDQGALIPDGEPVGGSVTHIGYTVAKP